MVESHPFHTLFETFGKPPPAHADGVNRLAHERLGRLLDVPTGHPGRNILLRAPRAGHGKTHLLTRLCLERLNTHEFIPLHNNQASHRIDAPSVIEDALHRLLRALPAAGGLCPLDLLTRRLFALALQPLVASGEVPCQDREAALAALRNRSVETFDFHHPNAVTAHWARENFELLGQRLAMELARESTQSPAEALFWVETFFRFASTPPEKPGRARALIEAVGNDISRPERAMDRLAALLSLWSLSSRIVLVADDIEGYSADETAALRLASFLTSLRQEVPSVDLILSVNQDIWSSAFEPRLSGGLLDRLSEEVVELLPLAREERIALLESRAPGLGETVLEHAMPEDAEIHARGLLQRAATAWLEAAAARAAGTPSTPAAPPPPAPAAQTPPNPPPPPPADEPLPPATPPAEIPTSSPSPPPPAVESETATSHPETPPAPAETDFPPSSPSPALPPQTSDRDRVDELLRQFRERFGR